MGAELRLVVGGVARVERHRKTDGRHGRTAGEHDLDPVRQPGAFDRRPFQIGDRLDLGRDALGHGRRLRSEERRVGKACVRTCRYRWSRSPYKKKPHSPQLSSTRMITPSSSYDNYPLTYT